IDGGNSRFTEDIVHAELASAKNIHYLDVGVSGGVWGLENGYGLMVGGNAELVARAMPVFDALRPDGPREEGFVHAGETGAGHYAKMVHNGIEYALMQAFAEGYELLDKRDDIIKDVTGTFKAWQRGTVVRSWLLELLVKALEEDPEFDDIEGYVEDSGEGRWTVEEAIANAVPVPTISASIFARFVSRQGDGSPAMKAVAALRNQFGGHGVKKAR
ncbi:MAG TPA: NADP-dependent phosphogluconate dehydrogenase, partial [Marisediminicola sp.]|nr:NADP-dependent phosphogluconate dehydrogenase [Marisediminicola sp.]